MKGSRDRAGRKVWSMVGAGIGIRRIVDVALGEAGRESKSRSASGLTPNPATTLWRRSRNTPAAGPLRNWLRGSLSGACPSPRKPRPLRRNRASLRGTSPRERRAKATTACDPRPRSRRYRRNRRAPWRREEPMLAISPSADVGGGTGLEEKGAGSKPISPFDVKKNSLVRGTICSFWSGSPAVPVVRKTRSTIDRTGHNKAEVTRKQVRCHSARAPPLRSARSNRQEHRRTRDA